MKLSRILVLFLILLRNCLEFQFRFYTSTFFVVPMTGTSLDFLKMAASAAPAPVPAPVSWSLIKLPAGQLKLPDSNFTSVGQLYTFT